MVKSRKPGRYNSAPSRRASDVRTSGLRNPFGVRIRTERSDIVKFNEYVFFNKYILYLMWHIASWIHLYSCYQKISNQNIALHAKKQTGRLNLGSK
ncbi:hypothetical protein M0804_015402 [Polistes exclamans]|nr:hypothetical protein M0804_015402 [Polistes exclamans]